MRLSLLQLGDSALPIGGYSHSWGLEAAVEQGTVRDAAGLENWLRHWLRFALAPFEGVVVAAVCRTVGEQDWPAALEANELLWTGVTPPTLRRASAEMGEQLLALAECWPWAQATVTNLRQAANPKSTVCHHAVVFGALAASAGATPAESLQVYFHQAALGMIAAGVKAIPIGHTHGQQILALVQADLYNLAEECSRRELATAGSSCPAYELYCHAQTRLYTRLFRS